MKFFRNGIIQFIILLSMVLGLGSNLEAAFWDTVKKTAEVKVKNETQKEIEALTVVHKYSNVYKEQHTWGSIANMQITSDSMIVNYNIGGFTTGTDWWFITWKYKGENRVYYTSPNNFRDVIDYLESLIIDSLPDIGKAAEAYTGSEYAQKAVTIVGGELFNTESTVGFKRHLLRANDAKDGLLITIKQGSVEFSSRSGFSSTEGIASYEIDAPIKDSDADEGITYDIVETSVDGFSFTTGPLHTNDLPSQYGDISKVTIYASQDGYVNVFATGMISVTNKKDNVVTHVFVGISDTSNKSPSSYNHTRYTLSANANSGTYLTPYSIQAVFPVSEGSHTFYLLGRGFGAEKEMLWENRMTAIFYPK